MRCGILSLFMVLVLACENPANVVPGPVPFEPQPGFIPAPPVIDPQKELGVVSLIPWAAGVGASILTLGGAACGVSYLANISLCKPKRTLKTYEVKPIEGDEFEKALKTWQSYLEMGVFEKMTQAINPQKKQVNEALKYIIKELEKEKISHEKADEKWDKKAYWKAAFNGLVEGLAVTHLRLDDDNRYLEVSFISTAPWNQMAVKNPPHEYYSGVGISLMEQIYEYAKSEKVVAIIGTPAKSALDFYKKIAQKKGLTLDTWRGYHRLVLEGNKEAGSKIEACKNSLEPALKKLVEEKKIAFTQDQLNCFKEAYYHHLFFNMDVLVALKNLWEEALSGINTEKIKDLLQLRFIWPAELGLDVNDYKSKKGKNLLQQYMNSSELASVLAQIPLMKKDFLTASFLDKKGVTQEICLPFLQKAEEKLVRVEKLDFLEHMCVVYLNETPNIMDEFKNKLRGLWQEALGQTIDQDNRLVFSSKAPDAHRVEILSTYLSPKAVGVDINLQDQDGQTALIWAAKERQTEVIKALLELTETDADLKDNDFVNAFLYAAREKCGSCVNALVSARSNLKINEIDYDTGMTGLMYLVGHGLTWPISLLLKRKDLDVGYVIQEGKGEGYTALRLAQENNHPEIVQMLLEKLK